MSSVFEEARVGMSIAKDEKLGGLMQGLIYPAFLGAGFVWTASSFARQYQSAGSFASLFTTIENYFAIWLLAYFCVPFMMLTYVDLPKKYWSLPFAANLGDVLAIFFAFLSLGFVFQKPVDMSLVYWSIAAIPIFAGIGNFSVNRPPKWPQSIAALLITIPMALWGHSFDFLNVVAIILLYVVLFFYFRVAAA